MLQPSGTFLGNSIVVGVCAGQRGFGAVGVYYLSWVGRSGRCRTGRRVVVGADCGRGPGVPRPQSERRLIKAIARCFACS